MSANTLTIKFFKPDGGDADPFFAVAMPLRTDGGETDDAYLIPGIGLVAVGESRGTYKAETKTCEIDLHPSPAGWMYELCLFDGNDTQQNRCLYKCYVIMPAEASSLHALVGQELPSGMAYAKA